MNAFRGNLAIFMLPSSVEPHFDGSQFSVKDVVVPSSSEYTLGDLLSAGVPVSPVSTDILHDDNAVNALSSLDNDNNNNNK